MSKWGVKCLNAMKNIYLFSGRLEGELGSKREMTRQTKMRFGSKQNKFAETQSNKTDESL